MTDEEVMALHRKFHTLVGEQLGQLMSPDGKKGVVAMRLFYALDPGDGSPMSAGQAGLTHPDHKADAIMLIRKIPTILQDPEANREVQLIDVGQKQ